MPEVFTQRHPTIGVVGPASVETTLQDAQDSLDVAVSIAPAGRDAPGSVEEFDCVIAAVTPESSSVDRTDADTAASLTEVSNWAVRNAARDSAPPVVYVAPTEASIAEALEAGVTEYLPWELLAQSPTTVLKRAVTATEVQPTPDYRTIYDNVSEPLTLHDPQTGELIHANRRLCELLKYDRAELISMQVGDYTASIDGYDQAAAMEVITSATEDGTVGPIEWPLETADGEHVWVEATLTTVTIDDQELVLATATDVTNRRRQRRQFREISTHIDEVVYLARADLSEVLFINEAYADLFNQPVERLYDDPMAVLDAVHPDDREAYRSDLNAMSEHIREEESGPYTFSHRLRVGGETRWVEVRGYPSRGPGGAVDRIVGVIRDVTDARRREREYEQIFNGVTTAIAVHDPDTSEMVDVNDSYVELFGYDYNTILQQGINDLSVPEEGYTDERARRLITDVGETEEDETVEWRIETAEGDHRLVEANLTVATVGGQRRVLSLMRDITEQKRREREYEQIFNGVNDAIAIFDPETLSFASVNDSYHELVGCDDLERIRELGIEGLSATEEGYTPERGKELIQAVARSGEPKTIEWKLAPPDEEQSWIEVTLATAEIGGERRVLSIQRDITERKRREREFEQIFNGVTDVIGVYDPQTAELLDVNDTMCELLGYDRDTIIDMDPEEVTATALGFDADTIGEVVRDVAKSGDPLRDIEWALRTASGDVVWLEVNATLTEIGGEQRVVTIARDVTGRRDREERVQVLNRVLRHNVRNDMDAVLGYTATIEETAEDEVVREYAESVHDIANSLLELSGKARAASQMLQDNEDPENRRVGTVLESVVADLRESHDEATIQLSSAEAPAPADTAVFRLVLSELVENAVEHGGDSPKVEIETTPSTANDETRITVRDDGPGISDRVLTPFRADGESPFQHNHGIGLWLVNWGVRQLGGGIEFERPADGGTVVHLSLPNVLG
ncbi:PAS domain S-box-containing protein [Halorubrum aquaticum]|uniref:histidine kinase n=1 Tax=Halorubrum aquaticum TaxID=387340 RepID=A0A1I3AM46_9EURY|nr:PAS domain S-box protein [Halorubrum aquaticum]SFH51168.1 PAS domain S-box-containing protein [Halorubrum aquaticum]